MAMKDSYKTAGDVYFAKLEKEKPAEYRKLRRIAAGKKSIVVGGSYDHAQDVLKAMRVDYLLVSGEELARTTLPLDRPVIVNCAGSLGDREIALLEQYVKNGGTLITTDWALKHVIEKSFPGYVTHNGRSTGDDVVDVDLTSIGSRLLPGVVEANDTPRWWLEGSSYPIKVIDKANVDVLITSEEMHDRYGDAPIVVRFRYGNGLVYHMVSHIYLQRAEERSARQRGCASEFVKSKSVTPGEVAFVSNQTVGEMEAAYLSVALIAHILEVADGGRKAA